MNEESKARLEFDKEESKKRARQRCLELAMGNNDKAETEDILKRAEKFAEFVNGEA